MEVKTLKAYQDTGLETWDLTEKFKILAHRVDCGEGRLVLAAQVMQSDEDLRAGQMVPLELLRDYRDDIAAEDELGEFVATFDLQILDVPESVRQEYCQATVFGARVILGIDSSVPADQHEPDVPESERRVSRNLWPVAAGVLGVVVIGGFVWRESGEAGPTNESSATTLRDERASDAELFATSRHGYPAGYWNSFDLLRERKFVEAQAIYDRFKQAGSVYGDIGEGWRHIYQEQYDLASTAFQRAETQGLEGMQRWPTYLGHSLALARLDQTESARRYARKVLAIKPTAAKHYVYRVEAFLRLNDRESAIQAMQEAVRLEPVQERFCRREFPELFND